MFNVLRLVPLVVVCGLSSCLGGGNSVNLYGGYRALEADDFDDVDDNLVYGVDGVWNVGPWWLGLEGGYLRSEDDSDSASNLGLTDVDLTVDEGFAGVRITPFPWFIKPYAAVGATYLMVDIDGDQGANSVSDDDNSFAGYGRVGAAIELTVLRFGVDFRAVVGSDLGLGGSDTDIDYYEALLFVGIGF
jgi:hypothetical protein